VAVFSPLIDICSNSVSVHDCGQALLELQRAAASDPKDPEAPYVLGMIFLQKNDPAHAIQWLQKALALKPDYAAAQEALNQATGKKD